MNEKLLFSSLGMAMGLSGMILEAFVMILAQNLELLFFLYFVFIFYWNFRNYTQEIYRIEGRDRYGFLIKETINTPLKETSKTSMFLASGFIFLLLITLLIRAFILYHQY